jgi:hypothetical protein
MSVRYLIRLTPPSLSTTSSTSNYDNNNNNNEQEQRSKPSDLLSFLQSLRTSFVAGSKDADDQTTAAAAITFSHSSPSAVLSSTGQKKQQHSSSCWTLRLDCCQEDRRDAGAAGSNALPSQLLARSSLFHLSLADRLLIQSVKWFTLGRCLLALMQGATTQHHSLGSLLSSAQQGGRNLLAYPSDAHSQTRLMVAACVTVRVLSSLDWSSMPVRLAWTPTPRVELQQCCDDE